MPHINGATPICKEQNVLDDIFASLNIEHLNTKNYQVPPPELRNGIAETLDPPDENIFSQVRENDSCDSAYGTASDEDDRLNSGLSSVDSDSSATTTSSILDPIESFDFWNDAHNSANPVKQNLEKPFKENSISKLTSNYSENDKPHFVLDTTDSFDFWNKTNISLNPINQSIKKPFEESSVAKLTSNGSDDVVQTSISKDVGDFCNLLICDLNEENFDYKSESISRTNSQEDTTLLSLLSDELLQKGSEQKTVTNDFDLNLDDFLNEISTKAGNKVVNSESISKLLQSEDTCKTGESLNSSKNLLIEVDSTYSDIFSSLYKDNSSKLNNTVNNSLNFTENDECLSDLLASMCVENSNINEKNSSLPLKSCSNLKSNYIDANDISLASLAEEYLSSKSFNFCSSSHLENDSANSIENVSLNSEEISVTNLSSVDNRNIPEPFDMYDLFAAINEKHNNQEKTDFNDVTNDLSLKLDLNNSRSQISYPPNNDEVALFAEKYINNDDSADETDGDIDIDFTTCLKSEKHSNSCSKELNVTNDVILVEENSDISPLRSSPPFLVKVTKETDSSLLKSKGTKSKPSLFSKALSCKPRKDPSAALKVLNIQKEICEGLFNPSQGIDTFAKPKKSVICHTDDFIFSTLGRRIFEHGKYHEVR